jgi:hypothetical protein
MHIVHTQKQHHLKSRMGASNALPKKEVKVHLKLNAVGNFQWVPSTTTT